MKMGLNQVLTPACPVGSGLLPSQKVCPALCCLPGWWQLRERTRLSPGGDPGSPALEEGGTTQTKGVIKKTMYNYQIYISVRYSRPQKNPGGAATRVWRPSALSASPCVPARQGRRYGGWRGTGTAWRGGWWHQSLRGDSDGLCVPRLSAAWGSPKQHLAQRVTLLSP